MLAPPSLQHQHPFPGFDIVPQLHEMLLWGGGRQGLVTQDSSYNFL